MVPIRNHYRLNPQPSQAGFHVSASVALRRIAASDLLDEKPAISAVVRSGTKNLFNLPGRDVVGIAQPIDKRLQTIVQVRLACPLQLLTETPVRVGRKVRLKALDMFPCLLGLIEFTRTMDEKPYLVDR